MSTFVIKLLLYVLIIFHFSKWIFSSNQHWTYDLTDVKFLTSDPSRIDGSLEIIRISRGVFGISGSFNIKTDIDDTTTVEGQLYRSAYGKDDYSRLPFDISNETFSVAMNKYYKPLIMDTVRECTKDAPLFEEFKVPLTKRFVKMNACQISIDNMPPFMAEGQYKMLVMIHGPVEVSIETYFTIENKGL